MSRRFFVRRADDPLQPSPRGFFTGPGRLLWAALLVLVGCCAAGVASPPGVLAQPPGDGEAELRVEPLAAPWLNQETGGLEPMEVRSSTADTQNRDSRWLPKPDKVRRSSNATPTGAGGGGAGGGGTAFGNNIGSIFGWTMMVLGGILIIGLLVYFFSKAENELELGAGSRAKPAVDAFDDLSEKVEELPVEVRQQGSDMRGLAQQWSERGDYDRAIICLFGHQLLLLDRFQVLRLTRGKTNRAYLRETASHPEARSVLGETVASFEASYFGRHPVTQPRMEFLWEENERLEQWVRQRQEAAA